MRAKTRVNGAEVRPARIQLATIVIIITIMIITVILSLITVIIIIVIVTVIVIVIVFVIVIVIIVISKVTSKHKGELCGCKTGKDTTENHFSISIKTKY